MYSELTNYYSPYNKSYYAYPNLFYLNHQLNLNYIPVQIENSIDYSNLQHCKFINTQNILQIEQECKHEQYPLKIQTIDLVKTQKNQLIKQNNKLNIKNILPNLCKKLFSFLTSKTNKLWIFKINPSINEKQLANFNKFLLNLRKQNKMYLGKKDLRRIWHKKPTTPVKKNYQRLVRILSYIFLTEICPKTIILSKKIKPTLKVLHLTYRRKLLKILIRKTKLIKKI